MNEGAMIALSMSNDLRQLEWFNKNPLCIYGDESYSVLVSFLLLIPYQQLQNNEKMKIHNKAMAEVRLAVTSQTKMAF